jgi:serine/threonine protein kinase/Flp pilus assembly protein TadD
MVGHASGDGSRYRPVRFYAKGGLGEVHVAEDGELGRQVALKRIQDCHAGNESLRRRFLREAELTARLEHPGIVPVHGLVQGADGQPYYAMRFVEGQSLREAVEAFHRQDQAPGRDPGERRLALRELLGRFFAVCNTVAFAHDRGVVHRDLKPANIMLGRYGETFVVDWGLAKDMRGEESAGVPEGSDASAAAASSQPRAPVDSLTKTGRVAGTPAYMSPEQAAGHWDAVGPAADIYGLGAILYVLLTGRPPLEGRDAAEVLARVQRGDFPRPRQLRPDVPRALEAVCLKAMALGPQDRYASALELRADVERWLADEPVSAYREPWTTRVRRRVRRHRALATGVAAAALVALLLGVGGWLWLADRRADTERRMGLALGAARQRFEQAVRLEAQGAADPQAALTVWREGLAAAEQAGNLGAAGWSGSEARQEAARLVAELRDGAERAGRALAQARKDARMRADLEAARMVRSAWKGRVLDYEASARAYARAFSGYGLDPRHPSAARALRQVPAPLRETLVAALDDWALCASAEAPRLYRVADAADKDSWRRRLRRAGDLATLRRLGDAAGKKPPAAVSLDLLAGRLERAGVRAEALAVWRRAQQLYPRDFWVNFNLGHTLCETDRTSRPLLAEAIGYLRVATTLRPQSGPAHNDLGAALQDTGDLTGAVAEMRRAVACAPTIPLAHTNLGSALHTGGDLAGAEAAHRRAVALDPNFAPTHYNLGLALYARRRLPAAAAALRRAVALNPRYAQAYYNLGVVLEAQGDPAAALAEYQRALEWDGKLAPAHINLGGILEARGDLKGSITHFRQAAAADPRSWPAHYNLAQALARKRDLAGALAAFRSTVALAPGHAQAHTKLGTVLEARGDLAGAVAEHRRALALDPKLAEAHYNLGNAFFAQEDWAEAASAFGQAAALRPEFAEAQCNLGLALQRQGKFGESLARLRRGHQLGTRRRGWPYPSAGWVQKAERFIRLDGNLPAFLKGERRPQSAAEGLELAELCGCKRLYRAAVRFYRAAFAQDPQAEAAHRYAAARAAARGAFGKGAPDGGESNPDHRAEQCRRALVWLRADLGRWAQVLEQGSAPARATLRRTLRYWRQDRALALVRDPRALARLPDAERRAWSELWADVEALLQKAGRDP